MDHELKLKEKRLHLGDLLEVIGAPRRPPLQRVPGDGGHPGAAATACCPELAGVASAPAAALPLRTQPIGQARWWGLELEAAVRTWFGNDLHPNVGYGGKSYDALHATYEGSYFGFVTTMDVYGFQINNGQRIVSSIWIVNRGGNDGDEKNEIMIGWQVFPQMYGDSNTHFFTHWTRDSTRTTGCYDMKCPGFELTPGSPLAPGDVIRPVSDVNGARQKITIKVFRDKPTGNWWKHYGFNRASAAMGYYPASLFTTLTEKATNILFGGSALAVDGVPSPAMGSGSLPSIMSDRAASMEGISLIDEDGRVAPFDAETIKTETMSFCYAMTPIFGANSSRCVCGGHGGCVG
ncbi:uncharacterized protein LOC102700295 [Oryza brachyantha]|uniref:uncharacterized protein LOC102700295 n=1 Tax=Oryza brachyantha TaxID=4533 RepID=UPI001ADA35A3|nr:uncharacterized protein LOC102700295 [Oryza brachyantha]